MSKLRTEDLRILANVCDDLKRNPDVILFARQHRDDRSASDRRVIFRNLKERGMQTGIIAMLCKMTERAVQKATKKTF